MANLMGNCKTLPMLMSKRIYYRFKRLTGLILNKKTVYVRFKAQLLHLQSKQFSDTLHINGERNLSFGCDGFQQCVHRRRDWRIDDINVGMAVTDDMLCHSSSIQSHTRLYAHFSHPTQLLTCLHKNIISTLCYESATKRIH